MPMLTSTIAAMARISARSAPSSLYNRHARKPQTIAAAKNGQAARTGSWSITIAPATAVMLRRIGTRNHQMMLGLSQRRWDSTVASTAPALRMALAAYTGITYGG